MAILQMFPVKEFYSEADHKAMQPGQLCRVVVPHISEIPQILDVERAEPEEHTKIKFALRNANPDKDFRASDRNLPIKYLNLKSNEELLIQRAKKRPGIILSNGMDTYPEITKLLRQKGKKHLQEDSIFVIPCYSTVTYGNTSGFIPEMVSRIRCLLYRQFFYLPPHIGLKESVARFDRIQVIPGRNPAAIELEKIALSKKVFDFFIALFLYCISGIEDQDTSVIRELVRNAYSG